ncbi:MAG: peptide chain release factor 2 [Bacilli bacterium]|nr:peptide chain release factor 2 [Bacilli bacterium]MDD4607710.1 peptide chain release factor 2 [Bacilli bacterium]
MNYGGHFDPEIKENRIKELETIMIEPNFWDDKQHSEKVINELNDIKNDLKNITDVKNQVTNNIEMLEILQEEFDEELKQMLETDLSNIDTQLKDLKVSLLLNGEYDKENAIVEIHSGAGGTEACDWAMMLYRMYTRYFSKKGYKVEVVDEQSGDEAGIKSVTMLVKGFNVFGYLKAEKGVHRLVRISPFDSNSRRHTSFASVDITPLFDNKEVNIDIKENDLKIDVYRSTGAGGQSVNTTDSAVRITHLPTKIVVTCQNERSQIQNKEKALEILKNKLYQLELEKREAELKNIKGTHMDINFGSQIRSYILHPYSLIKDHRTNFETSNVDKVLDGDIDLFISEYLLKSFKVG